MIVFDIESEGLPLYSKYLVGAYASCADLETGEEVSLVGCPEKMVKVLASALADDREIIGHNIICYDLPLLYFHTKHCQLLWDIIFSKSYHIYDTLLLSRLMYPRLRQHSVAAWTKELGIESKVEIEDFSNVDMETLEKRVIKDVQIQFKIWDYMSNSHIPEQYKSIQDFTSLMVEMLGTGVTFDKNKAKDLETKLITEKLFLRNALQRKLPNVANFNSPKQIHEALLKKRGRGLPLSEKGNPTFNKQNQHKVAKQFPELNALIDYKHHLTQLSFLSADGKKSFYTRLQGGSIYPSMSFCSTITYRSQYSNPPLNQMDKRLRDIVAAPDNSFLIGFDLDSLEFRVLGHGIKKELGSTDILDELDRGNPKQKTLDVFGSLFDNVTGDKEATAKQLNYAILYGQGIASTLKLLNLDGSYKREVEEKVSERFFAVEEFKHYLLRKRYNETILNYYRQKVHVNDDTTYCIVNYYCQSSGAFYAMHIFSLLHGLLKKSYKDISPIIFNHDEVNYLCREPQNERDERKVEEMLDDIHTKLKEKDEYITSLNYNIGKNWSEIH